MAKTHPLIAVVDDEESICKALTRLMHSAGLDVETFSSGAEFLKSIDGHVPDCVVLDLHMPQLSGFAVQAHLTRVHAGVPVIVITGHDSPEAREHVMERGASAYLRKPVDDRALLDAISAAIAQASESRNADSKSDGIPPKKISAFTASSPKENKKRENS